MARRGQSSNKPKGVAGNAPKAPKNGRKRARNAQDPDEEYQDGADTGGTSNTGARPKKKQKTRSGQSSQKKEAEPRPELPAIIDPADDGWNNRTSPVRGQEHWAPENLPDILYSLDEPPEHRVRRRRPTETKRIHGKDLPDFPILPDNISSKVEEFRVEAWLRLDRRLQLADITNRMHPRFRIHKNALQMRGNRFRGDCNMIAWKSGNSRTDIFRDQLIELLETNGIDPKLNSTRGVTPGLINPALGEAGGRIPLPAEFRNRWIQRKADEDRSRLPANEEIVRGIVGGDVVDNSHAGNSQVDNSQAVNPQVDNSHAANSQVDNPQAVNSQAGNSQVDNSHAGNSQVDDGQDGDDQGDDWVGKRQDRKSQDEKRPGGNRQHDDCQVNESLDGNARINQAAKQESKMNIGDGLPQVVTPVKVEQQPTILNGDDWLDLGLESEDEGPNEEEARSMVNDFRYQGITQQDIDTLFAPENVYDQTVRDVATEVSANIDMLDGPTIEDPKAEREAEMIERLLEHFLRKQGKRSGQLRNMRNLPHLRSLMALHM